MVALSAIRIARSAKSGANTRVRIGYAPCSLQRQDDGRLAVKPEMTDKLPERVDAIEQKLDHLAASVDARFEQVDGRFDQVDRRFEQVDRRFDQVDRRFEQVDRRFEQVDRRFDEVTAAIVEERQYTEFAFTQLRTEMVARFEQVERRLEETATQEQVARLERKLDQFIDRWSPPARRRSGQKKR